MSEEQRPLIGASKGGFSLEAPYLISYRSSKAFILVTVCLALFTDSFIYGVLVPVLPFMLKGRCHVRDGTEQLWTSALFAAFGAAILIGSPVCGWFADRSVSRRLPLLFGLPILILAAAMIGASESVWVLLASRLLQGFSTAITWTVGLSLTRDTAGKDEVGQWMGTALSSSSVGLIISPLLGGIVFEASGIMGVLGMMIALIVLNIFFITTMIEQRVARQYLSQGDEEHEHENDHGTFSDFSWGGPDQHAEDNEQVRWGADYAESSNCSVDGLPSHENEGAPGKSTMNPMLRLLRSPRVLTGVYGVFTQFGLLASFDAFLPLFVERRFHWGSLGAGLIFLNIAVPAMLGPLAGKISDRYGPRKVALAGCILTAPPLILIRLVGRDSKQDIILLCALLVLAGLFLTLIISPLAADLSFAVDQMEADEPGCFGEKGAYAQAYALFNCSMAAATVVGPLLSGGIQDRFGAPGVSLVMGLWCLSAALPVVFFIGDGQGVAHVEQPIIPHRMSIAQSPHISAADARKMSVAFAHGQ